MCHGSFVVRVVHVVRERQRRHRPRFLAACGNEAPPWAEEPPTTTPAAAQLLNVQVKNSAEEAIPTTAVGTTTVAGNVAATQSGTWNVTVDNALSVGGTVAAQQSGAWNVGVTGNVASAQAGAWSVDVDSLPPVALAAGTAVDVGSLPPVTLAGTPSVAIANTPNVYVSGAVAISNGPAAPVPVKVQGATQTRWQKAKFLSVGSSSYGLSTSCYTVPAGKRLVIELVTARVQVPPGQLGLYVHIDTGGIGSGADFVNFYMPLTNLGSDGTYAHSSIAQQVKIIADAGENVSCGFERSGSTGDADAVLGLSGYLVDL